MARFNCPTSRRWNVPGTQARKVEDASLATPGVAVERLAVSRQTGPQGVSAGQSQPVIG